MKSYILGCGKMDVVMRISKFLLDLACCAHLSAYICASSSYAATAIVNTSNSSYSIICKIPYLEILLVGGEYAHIASLLDLPLLVWDHSRDFL